MNQRDALLVLGAVVLAMGVTAVLLVGVVAAERGEIRPRFFVGERPPAGVRLVDNRLVPDPGARGGVTRVPPGPIPGEAVLVPVQRGVANAARDAAGYLLILLGVAGSLVLAREPVLACYRATIGGWRTQARVIATGIAVLALLASAGFLSFVVMLGTAANLALPRAPVPVPLQPLLQSGFLALVVAFVFLALVTIVGVAASGWRLGDAILGARPLASWAGRVPAPLVAIAGTTLLYLAAQLPYVGTLAALLAIAYALGTVVTARLGQAPAIPAGSSS